VTQKFCESNHSFKITVQFTLWDYIKSLTEIKKMSDKDIRRLSNIARFTANLILNEAISLAIFRILNFAILRSAQVSFLQQCFCHLIASSDLHASANAHIPELFYQTFQKEDNLQDLKEGILLFLDQFIIEKLDEADTLGLSGVFKSMQVNTLKKRIPLIRNKLLKEKVVY
jgi:nucleolar MIF4G domain-containing protein 1